VSTLAQVKIIYTLLGLANLRDQKDDIIMNFTGGRTDSVSKMDTAEAAALIAHLKSADKTESSSTKMRNKILSMAHEMNWTHIVKTTPGTPFKSKVDMEHVDNWCKAKGYLHKPLDDYTYNELPKLVSQFEEVYKSYLNKV
jgi:hypothetical protein